MDLIGHNGFDLTDFWQVYLAMEARESGCDLKAMHLISEFLKKFRFIDFTLHPGDVPNEAPGKSSNIAWAARKASERYQTKIREDVIITVVDGRKSHSYEMPKLCSDKKQLIVIYLRVTSS